MCLRFSIRDTAVNIIHLCSQFQHMNPYVCSQYIVLLPAIGRETRFSWTLLTDFHPSNLLHTTVRNPSIFVIGVFVPGNNLRGLTTWYYWTNSDTLPCFKAEQKTFLKESSSYKPIIAQGVVPDRSLHIFKLQSECREKQRAVHPLLTQIHLKKGLK